MGNSHTFLSSVKRRRTIIRFTCLICSIICVVCFLFLFRVKAVSVENNTYTLSESILSSSGISSGIHMYAIDKEKIIGKIINDNPYIYDVEIRRDFPSRLRIIVREENPVFYTSFSGKFYMLTGSLRVLETADSSYAFSAAGAVPVVLSGISAAENGKYLAFADKTAYSFNVSLISSFLSSEISDDITSLDISRKFDIKAMYKSKYTLVFGSYDNLENKLRFCIKTIGYTEKNMPSVKGTVYAMNSDETSFVVTGTVN